MTRIAALLPLFAIAACAQTQAAPSQGTQSDAGRPQMETGACDASGLDDLVGQPGTSDLAADAMARSGATKLRWIQPGMAVTMDYRTDRLNINLDQDNVVTGFKCG